MQISPLIIFVNGFKNGFHRWIQRIFLVVVEAKKFSKIFFVFKIFRRRASRVTGNTLIKPDYASVRQSRDSLHRDRHNVTKKSGRRRALKPLELKRSKNSPRRILWHTTMLVSLV